MGTESSGEPGRPWSIQPPHRGPVTALAVGRPPGGRTVLVSGSSDGGVRRWDAITGVALDGPLHGTGWVWSSAATTADDGRALVVGGFQDGRLERWDAATGRRLAGGALTGWVRSVVTARLNGRTVAFSGSDDGDVRRWDAVTGLPVGDPITAHTGPVRALAVVGSSLFSASDDGDVRCWDLGTGRAGDSLTGHTAPVLCLVTVVLPDGRTLLVGGCRDGAVSGGTPRPACCGGTPRPGDEWGNRSAVTARWRP